MKTYFLPLLFICLFGIGDAHAARYRFGDQDQVHFVQEMDLAGPNSEDLFLGRKITTKFFIAGAYLTDHGFVLGVRGKKGYYALTPEKLATLQAAGHLPDPLPEYQISTWDYIIGYSLWLILGAVVLLSLLGVIWNNFKAKRRTKALQRDMRRVLAKAIMSDGQVDNRELVAANTLYEQFFGVPFSKQDFATEMKWVKENSGSWDKYVRKLNRTFPQPLKVACVRAFTFILLSDENLQQSERAELEQFARNLGFGDNDIKMLIQNATTAVNQRETIQTA